MLSWFAVSHFRVFVIRPLSISATEIGFRMLRIDGAEGEGGGQIVRSSLALSILTGTPLHIENIRLKRDKPGLRRQHLTAVRAAATICDAEVEGAQLGSRAFTFEPKKFKSGD